MSVATDLSRPWTFYDPTGHWTRNPAPAGWPYGNAPVLPVLDLSSARIRMFTAVHEAAHAVVAAAHPLYVPDGGPNGPMRLDGVQLYPREMEGRPLNRTGTSFLGPMENVDYYDFTVWCAAGERANERWLDEEGLWTPRRGWVAESGGFDDRCNASTIDPRWRLAYTDEGRARCEADGVSPVDWTDAQREADELLDELWPYVLRVAGLLFTHGRLTGHQVRAIVSGHTPREN